MLFELVAIQGGVALRRGDVRQPGEVIQCVHPVRAGHRVSIHAPREGRDGTRGSWASFITRFQSTRPVRGATKSWTISTRPDKANAKDDR